MSKPPSFQPVTNNPMPPPWQVKWKRPRLDTVQLGFEPDDDDDDGDGDHDDAAASECEELINELKDDWVPVSCSSVVLTRDEARRALMELYRRDRLLVKRRRVSSYLSVLLCDCYNLDFCTFITKEILMLKRFHLIFIC